jgi:subtilisin family serine protease
MSKRRTAALLLGVGTLAGLVVAPAGAEPDTSAPAQASATPAGPAGSSGTVTLLTGDKVSYQLTGGTLRVTGSTPASRRRGTAFARFAENGRQYVLPKDAWGAVARGQVDRELFDVTALVAQRLDDAHTDRIRVLVTGRPGAAPKTAAATARDVTRTMPRLGIQAMSTAKSQASTLWASLTGEQDRSARVRTAAPAAGTRIWLDGVVHATLDESVPLIGAPTAWAAGWTGAGVKVAVLDTGIASAHPDLAGKVEASQNFSDAADADDHMGHGTHVASIITGSGAASGGRYRGVAPGVRLLNGKVLGDDGSGYDSSILAGMDWAVQQGAKVVNMSLGGEQPGDGKDVLSTEIDRLSASSGTLFVVAAGNAGGSESVTAPGAADAALTVASTTKQDTLSGFSSRGPRIGDFGLKPEIAAPGQDITAARAPGAFPQSPGDANYVTLSGTSMATPHVAGAGAIVAGEHPDWTGQQIKAALTGSAKVLDGIGVFGDGAGRVDVTRATAQTVRAETPTIGLGKLAWPHDPAEPTTAQVRYANDGDTAVTLGLNLAATGADGSPAPAGLFSADTSLTVPAHSTATATVRVAAGPGSVGAYTGRLTATAGDTHIVTPLAVQVMELTHDVTVTTLDRSGQPMSADDALVLLQNDTTGSLYPVGGEGVPFRAAVPEGTYRVLAIAAPAASEEITEFALDGIRVGVADRSVTLDAREGRPSTVSVDDPDARPDLYTANTVLLSHAGSAAGGGEGDVVLSSNYPDQYVVSPRAIPGVDYAYAGAWARPQNRITTVGADPYEVGDVVDPQRAGFTGDITAGLVDIGEQTDPALVGDVSGKVVLIAPDLDADPVDPPTQDQLAALVKGLKAKGARLVVSYDYIDPAGAGAGALPVLLVYRPEDIKGLRGRLAAGQRTVHVVGQPASPALYALYSAVGSKLPSGQAWHFTKARLARVDATYHDAAGSPYINDEILSFHDPATGLSGAVEHWFAEPQTRVEYLTPEVAWSQFTDQETGPGWDVSGSELTVPTTYHLGQRATATWGGAPLAPRLPRPLPSGEDGKPVPAVYRQGDRLVAGIPVFNPTDLSHTALPDSDMYSQEPTAEGATQLFQGSTLVASNEEPGVGAFTLPADPGTYRLVTRATRPSSLSTEVASEWTFTTGHTATDARTPVNLLDLGFGLPLDGMDAAPAGKALTGTVSVQPQTGSVTDAAVRAVTVAVSYDDGKTWHKATVKASGDGGWTVVIPAGGSAGGYATLRASAVDAAGNAVRQTVTRAYRLR